MGHSHVLQDKGENEKGPQGQGGVEGQLPPEEEDQSSRTPQGLPGPLVHDPETPHSLAAPREGL